MAGYKKLYDINLSHLFFHDAICKNLSILPTVQTRQIFHNADLIFNVTKNGASVYFNENSTHSLKAHLDDEIEFCFKLKSNDPFFYNYTDLDHVYGNTLFFDSSKAHKLQDTLILSAGDIITSKDEVGIKDNLLKDIISREDKIAVPVGFIVVKLTDLITEHEAFDSYKPNRYSLTFKEKQTYWRYNFIKQNAIDYDVLKIQDNDQLYEFSEINRVRLSNGVIADQITSKKPISIHEFSEQNFNLIGIKDKQEKIIIKKLNAPGIMQITKENEKIISELYVYY